MIKMKKGGVMEFSGKDYVLVNEYAKEHKLTFKEVVYLALMNGIEKGYFSKRRKK